MLNWVEQLLGHFMVNTSAAKLSKSEFWALAEADDRLTYELIDGQAIVKMSPKYFHSRSTGKLFLLLQAWAAPHGRVAIEWAIELKDDSTPVPDLLYISFDRLPATWQENTACPRAPELAIEILSPGQTMAQMTVKAQWYLANGIDRVWIIDPMQATISVLRPDATPVTYQDQQELVDPLFPGLAISPQTLFTNL